MYNSLSRPGCDSECQWHLVGWDPGLVMNDFFDKTCDWQREGIHDAR